MIVLLILQKKTHTIDQKKILKRFIETLSHILHLCTEPRIGKNYRE